jgi:hypothetical protein
MGNDSYALNFVEYMKDVGDAAVNLAKEGAYGEYDFGQVAVGGGKILAKEGLAAIGADAAAANIVLDDDIHPLSSLGKVAAQGGYQALGAAVKDMPANAVGAVAGAVRQGDLRALGSAVTDAVLLADGATSIAKGLASGVRRVAGAAHKAETTLAKAAKAGNAEVANDAVVRCGKQNDVASRQSKQIHHQHAALGEKTAHNKMLQRQMEPLGSTDGVYRPGETGIDGVYKNSCPPPEYVITEVKYGKAKLEKRLADGTNQMDDDWVTNRLFKKVGPVEAMKIENAIDINPTSVEKWLIRVSADGTAKATRIDSNGSPIRGVMGRVSGF